MWSKKPSTISLVACAPLMLLKIMLTRKKNGGGAGMPAALMRMRRSVFSHVLLNRRKRSSYWANQTQWKPAQTKQLVSRFVVYILSIIIRLVYKIIMLIIDYIPHCRYSAFCNAMDNQLLLLLQMSSWFNPNDNQDNRPLAAHAEGAMMTVHPLCQTTLKAK